MGNRRLRYRELLVICRRYGVSELAPTRGKGSERIWERVVPEGKLATTVTCHNGPSTELGVGLISAVRRRLKLDPAHGVSDGEFYGRPKKKSP